MLAPAALSAKARAFPGLRIEELERSVLGSIINAKVEFLQGFVPAEIKAGNTARHQSLKQALSGPGRHFILECKRASPSLGDINLGLDFKAQVEVYNRYASAISVLTESSVFKGSYEFLRAVKAATSLPVILKDFVLDERELVNAKAIGADAVLLMSSVLTEERFMQLYRRACELGLEVLCEVSNREEADFALREGLQIVGINNRDLKTLQIDLNTARTLAPLFAGRDVVVVSESGIKSHQDLNSMHGLNNFLIGSAVCKAGVSADFAVKTLLFGLYKVCGFAEPSAVREAAEGHAALAGLIFAPRSPRCVSIAQARSIMAAVPAGQTLEFCAVFVDAPQEQVVSVVQALDLHFVQLHGSESPDYIRALQHQLPGVTFIKAIAVRDGSFRAQLSQYQDLNLYFLFDSAAPGSGKAFDHTLLDGVDKSRALLSGGISLDNLTAALSLGFMGLDLNSKLERAPGIKDPALVSAALAQITAYQE